ncbi:MAG TPA: NifU N-terminal domain-containing protein [Tepidisphaeraceae bacterium]|jgi:hypothetical protein
MALRVTDVHPTPNPNALKYSLDGKICETPVSFFKAEDGRDHPVASRLFAISGVDSVLLLHDFVTINKSAAAKWKDITPAVKKVLNGLDESAAEA